MKRLYYNTNHVSGQMLMSFEQSARMQNERVLEIFRLNSYRYLTTREAHAIYLTKYPTVERNGIRYEEPHDSIKRAITDLTKDGHLEMCSKDQRVTGIFGKPVYTWKLKQ